MFRILTVCTGNICRSPLAEQLLRVRLGDIASVTSAGTRGLRSAPMTPEALHLATHLGVPVQDASSHRSRFLTEELLVEPDIILTMTREHRRLVAELAPARLRSTFTIREFDRIASGLTREELSSATGAATDAGARVRALGAAVASRRGMSQPDDPGEDDVVDPYLQPWATYQRSAAELLPSVDATARLLRAVTASD